MDLKEFFRPTVSKLILPILVSIVFIILIFSNYHYMEKSVNHVCKGYKEYLVPMYKAYDINDNETAENIGEDYKEYNEKRPISRSVENKLEDSNAFFHKINPFHTVPCIPWYSEIDCRYSYLTEESFNCMQSPLKELDMITERNEFKEYEYNSIPIYYHLLSIVFLFFEVYLASCLILIKKSLKNKGDING